MLEWCTSLSAATSRVKDTGFTPKQNGGQQADKLQLQPSVAHEILKGRSTVIFTFSNVLFYTNEIESACLITPVWSWHVNLTGAYHLVQTPNKPEYVSGTKLRMCLCILTPERCVRYKDSFNVVCLFPFKLREVWSARLLHRWRQRGSPSKGIQKGLTLEMTTWK